MQLSLVGKMFIASVGVAVAGHVIRSLTSNVSEDEMLEMLQSSPLIKRLVEKRGYTIEGAIKFTNVQFSQSREEIKQRLWLS